MTASMIRPGLDLGDAVAELKHTFWRRLGYRDKASAAKANPAKVAPARRVTSRR
jgi:hypothetical protein